MTLQKKTIQRFRQLFPQETLKGISERTDIQITRVFRLLNGKPMRVEELEAFENAINSKLGENSNYQKLQSLMEEATSFLSNEDLGKINSYIERKLSLERLGRVYMPTQFQQHASIA